MNVVFDLFLKSPVIQVSLAVFIATIGLFITAAVQHRLRKLTAIVLAAVMLASVSAGAIDGTIQYFEKTSRTQMAQMEKDALAKLAAGDAGEAYKQAVDSIIAQPDRPGAWLIAARAALLAGDLSAADHYYGQLQGLSDADLEDWNMTDDADEINEWTNLSQLSKSEQRDAAGEFSETVRENIDEQIGILPDVQEEADNYGSLLEMEELLYNAQESGDNTIDIDELNAQLEDLMDEPGGEDARDILIDSLVWQEEWDSLLEWLFDDGTEGLIDIAELVLEGTLPEGELADALSADSDSDAVQELADALWNLQNSAGEDRARLYLRLSELYVQLLGDPDRALEIIMQALNMGIDQFGGDPTILRELVSLRLLLETLSEGQAEDIVTEWLGGEA
ncbi:MAG: hypothetical protein PHO15_04825, partial [Eubacteriales bacterium]|nr:hypothetical protein [Eubacteriales bacterium]